eukprot:1499439-Rhodomonas_salina.2
MRGKRRKGGGGAEEGEGAHARAVVAAAHSAGIEGNAAVRDPIASRARTSQMLVVDVLDTLVMALSSARPAQIHKRCAVELPIATTALLALLPRDGEGRHAALL